MKKPILFVILAVTKTYDKYCIAGMDQTGKWIRPLPVGGEKFWSSLKYTDGTYIKVGDVWNITEYEKVYDDSSPGHTEDIKLIENATFHRCLTNEQLIRFVHENKEDELALKRTLNGESRSLCLIEADDFRNFMDRNTFSGDLKPRITFKFQGIHYNNTTTSNAGYPITDLKWLAYTQRQISTPKKWSSIFICIGLARTEPKKGFNREYPMIISVITDPEVPLLSSYTR